MRIHLFEVLRSDTESSVQRWNLHIVFSFDQQLCCENSCFLALACECVILGTDEIFEHPTLKNSILVSIGSRFCLRQVTKRVMRFRHLDVDKIFGMPIVKI